jgi:dTDP-glucose 4,6-dehydratase
MKDIVLVTGGAGFIGSNFVLDWISESRGTLVNLDKLTYAGNLRNLAALENDPRHIFVRGDIADTLLVQQLLSQWQPRAIINFAAESHVDRSIHGPQDFVHTNINGTFRLLEATRAYYASVSEKDRRTFRFLHVSTDEVYGSLGPNDPAFTEKSPYAPSSPYAASKAASDHLVRAYHHTYGLPTLITNCSNNYGPYQFPEKLIPLMISNAVKGKPLPVYGDGQNIRDWLYVGDHCSAIRLALERGRVGETYNVGGNSETTNLEVVNSICRILDELQPRDFGARHASLIKLIQDRPGHDRRYAIDASKIRNELGWQPGHRFDLALGDTIRWYLRQMSWVENVISGEYRNWMELNYGQQVAT